MRERERSDRMPGKQSFTKIIENLLWHDESIFDTFIFSQCMPFVSQSTVWVVEQNGLACDANAFAAVAAACQARARECVSNSRLNFLLSLQPKERRSNLNANRIYSNDTRKITHTSSKNWTKMII